MTQFDEAVKMYENIKIPEQYESVVNNAIVKAQRRIKQKKTISYGVKTAAAAFCAMVLALNSSESFAKTMDNIPVIGGICRVLTIRSYDTDTQEGNVNITIHKPQFEVIQDEGGKEEQVLTAEQVAERVNSEITKKIDEYTLRANQEIEDYHKAFIQTGGTEEEWQKRNFKVDASYEIKSQTDQRLSFLMNYLEVSVSAYVVDYYNISLVDGHDITLQELLGDNYASIIEEQVRKQTAERMAEDSSLTYWIGTNEEYLNDDIFENPKFYLNEDGNVVVIYEKYQIAPGYMGMSEFEITVPEAD